MKILGLIAVLFLYGCGNDIEANFIGKWSGTQNGNYGNYERTLIIEKLENDFWVTFREGEAKVKYFYDGENSLKKTNSKKRNFTITLKDKNSIVVNNVILKKVLNDQ